MESSSSSRIIIPKNIMKKINPKKDKSNKLIKRNISTLRTNPATQSEELNSSWDFTPFPDLYFPSQKKQVIKIINGLNIKNEDYNPINLDYNNNLKNMNNINFNFKKIKKRKIILDFNKVKNHKITKSNSLSYLFQEKRGDITKNRSPSYTFGLSRDDCKFPYLRLNEKISPTPCSYNLRPLEGLGDSSIKYSFNKDNFLRKFKKYITPGPGHYNLDKYDLKNNGNIIPSHLLNSKIVNFAKYEERKNNKGINSPENIRPDPGSYDINNTLTMFSGTGRYPISNFRSNISKIISKINIFSRNYNNFIYPGPGHYNHYSIFTSHS